MKKFKYIFIGICVAAAFLFGRQCGVDSVDIPTYKNDTTVVHDTIYGDTVTVKSAGKPYAVHDTTWKVYTQEIDTVKLNEFFMVRGYSRTYKLGNLAYVEINDSVVGYLLSQKTNYRPIAPLAVTNSTLVSVKPQDSVKVAKKWELRASIDATPKNLFLGLEYQKDRLSYAVAYDPFNKQPKVGLRYTFIRR